MRIPLISILPVLLASRLTCAQPSTAPPACPEFPDDGPINPTFLASSPLSNPISIADITAIESIRHTTALYALAIDARSFSTLRSVFAPNATANYSDPLGVLKGVESIITVLTSSLATFASTQHLLGTQYVFVCGADRAMSVTYYTAAHFFEKYTGVANTVGNDKVLVDRSQYLDVWVKWDGRWVIQERKLARMGPITLDGGFPNATMV